ACRSAFPRPSAARRSPHALHGGSEPRTSASRADRLGRVRVLVIGSGGREHALCRALAAESEGHEVHCAPGNAGIAEVATLHAVSATDPAEVTALAKSIAADLVVIGPEAP